MAARIRIGRYENPYLTVGWQREPPAGTVCETFQLATQDRALCDGWLYRRGGEDSVVCVMHPRANFSHHYVVPALVEAGFAVFCQNSRWVGNDATLVHEVLLLDVAAGVGAMRERFDRVVLLGNSGGGSLYTFYLSQALAPAGERLVDTPAGDPFDLNRFELPRADQMVYLAAHPGEGFFLQTAIDPSVVDESDPVSCDSALDMFDPANGFAEPPDPSHYAPEFVACYRAAQLARIDRIDARARQRVDRRNQARRRAASGGGASDRRSGVASEYLVIYRTEADLRCTDPALDPSARDYGSLFTRRPDLSNYGAVGFARVLTPEAWLSTWSGRASRAEIPETGARMTLPALVLGYTGDNGIFPSDTERIAEALASPDLERAWADGDHYGLPAERGREPALQTVIDWLRRKA
ncbi:MAG: alpha/beta hydrolase [Myxococcales bacterium]|nr:alpha/beta hydrolase [Myxococcales bacterium]